MNKNLAILIPCYNCGEAVIPVLAACRTISNRILTVNDGSDDSTASVLAEHSPETIGWKRNRGKGAALLEGFSHLLQSDDWSMAATLDSDGQHNPMDLPKLAAALQNLDAGIVLGKRSFQRKAMPAGRYWANVLSSKMISMFTGCKIDDFQCGYRVFSRKSIEIMAPLIQSQAYSIETEMALLAHRLKIPLQEVEVETIYSEEASQKSCWRPLTDSWQIAKVVFRHLSKPPE